MRIHDHTGLTRGHKKRNLKNLDKIVCHRTHLPEQEPHEWAARWTDKKLGTGGKIPYHFVVRPSGEIWQTVRLDEVAPGARWHNTRGIHVAFWGAVSYTHLRAHET